MLCRKVLGRGFDSRRLHTSLRNLGRSEVCRAEATWRRRAVIVIGHFDPLRSRDSAARATSRQAGLQFFNVRSEVRRAVAVAAKADKFMSYYVYILQSAIDEKRFYTGFTEDLDSRQKAHNSRNVHHTSKYKPWRIKTAIAFTDRQKAIEFEKYLKTPSGRAFAKKRL